MVTAAEADLYRRRNAAAWSASAAIGGASAAADPFEAVPGSPGALRIRKRDDGACVFLSAANRCRIHEELGAAHKPLTCRLYPFAFHAAAEGVTVSASFNCPTIAANEGALVNEAANRAALDSLRKEWFAIHPSKPSPLALIKGRAMTTRSLHQLRQAMLTMLDADAADLRSGIRRLTAVLDDLIRSRVLSLSDEDFAEYVSLTVPHAAAQAGAPPGRASGAVARMLQYGFLYAVTAVRDDVANPRRSRTQSRVRRMRLLAHFHGLAPGVDGVNVAALKRRRVDINDDTVRPIASHYLRSSIDTLGTSGRTIVDELSTAASYLNAARALAAMHADAAGTNVNRAIFIQSLTEASDVSHARHPILERVLLQFSAGTNALAALAE